MDSGDVNKGDSARSCRFKFVMRGRLPISFSALLTLKVVLNSFCVLSPVWGIRRDAGANRQVNAKGNRASAVNVDE